MKRRWRCSQPQHALKAHRSIVAQFADQAYGLRFRIAHALTAARFSPRRSGAGDDYEAASRPWRAKGLALVAQFSAACSAAPLYLGVSAHRPS